MLGKFKGFDVPAPDSLFRKSNGDEKNIMKRFCLRSKTEDCSKTTCTECLFGHHHAVVTKKQSEAFQEWHKAKGKVEYDA